MFVIFMKAKTIYKTKVNNKMEKSHYSTATRSPFNSSFLPWYYFRWWLGSFTDRLLSLNLIAQQDYISIKLLTLSDKRMHISIQRKMSFFCWFICQKEIIEWDFFLFFKEIYQIFQSIGLRNLYNHFLEIFLFLIHD